MKQLLAIILWLPKLIVKMFWHLIKGFFTNYLISNDYYYRADVLF